MTNWKTITNEGLELTDFLQISLTSTLIRTTIVDAHTCEVVSCSMIQTSDASAVATLERMAKEHEEAISDKAK